MSQQSTFLLELQSELWVCAVIKLLWAADSSQMSLAEACGIQIGDRIVEGETFVQFKFSFDEFLWYISIVTTITLIQKCSIFSALWNIA